MNDEPLMEVALDVLLFFELCDDETVDDDTAVMMMEQIAYELKKLEPVEKERFLQYAQRRAAQATTKEEREAIEDTESGFGLMEENEGSAQPTNEPFLEVALDTLLFFELSEEPAINRDAAVAMIRRITATLQRLEPADKERFRQHLDGRVAQATTEERRRALEKMENTLGLTEE